MESWGWDQERLCACRQSRHLSALGSSPPPHPCFPSPPSNQWMREGCSHVFQAAEQAQQEQREPRTGCLQAPGPISASVPLSLRAPLIQYLVWGTISQPIRTLLCPLALCTPTLGGGALTPASACPAPASGQTAAPVVAVISQGCSDTN